MFEARSVGLIQECSILNKDLSIFSKPTLNLQTFILLSYYY